MAARAEKHGVLYLDAPISGGSVKAANGALSIMASGTPKTLLTSRNTCRRSKSVSLLDLQLRLVDLRPLRYGAHIDLGKQNAAVCVELVITRLAAAMV